LRILLECFCQKIIKVGTSAAVTIPKEFMHELNIKPGHKVDFKFIKTSGAFLYTPVQEPSKKKAMTHKEKVASITLKFINRYRDDLNALKDK
jgi:antitoxin component of MazEF toxin-antitoxin module